MKLNPIPVFYYHSVAPHKDPSWYKSFLTFEMIYFEDLLKYLSRQNYQFIDLDEYLAFRRDPSAKNKKLICLTFDDGYLDNYVYVYPLLKKYKAKGTIFVSPQYVQTQPGLRPGLGDVWSGKCRKNDLQSLGFLSWDELRFLQNSGVMDIQSHTMTHTKYNNSEILQDFHHPKADYLYPIGNLFPERLPYYITDTEFKNLLPYGTPFFKQSSSLVTQRVFINKAFEQECIHALKDYNWQYYNFESCMERINPVYQSYKNKNQLISHRETQTEYEERVTKEIRDSKIILEKELGKPINHVCWPHGDYNSICHEIAKEEGYSSSHIVLKRGERNINISERFDRTGSNVVRNSRFLTLLKAKYKLGSYRDQWPYSQINKIYRTFLNSENEAY